MTVEYEDGAADRVTAIKTVTRKGAGRHVISDMKHWGTPQKYVDAVKAVFGGSSNWTHAQTGIPW